MFFFSVVSHLRVIRGTAESVNFWVARLVFDARLYTVGNYLSFWFWGANAVFPVWQRRSENESEKVFIMASCRLPPWSFQ